MGKNFLLAGGILAALGVILGAGAAHALKHELTPEKLAYFQTGVLYQQVHAVGLILIGLTVRLFNDTSRLLNWSGMAMLFGICAFSGSLYVFALLDVKYITQFTPIGGSALIVSWVLFTIGVWRS